MGLMIIVLQDVEGIVHLYKAFGSWLERRPVSQSLLQ